MKTSKVMKIVCAAGIASVCVLGLSACNGNASNENGLTGGVAATVNGTEIAEDTVTEYIQNFRTSQAMDTEEPWGKWLSENSFTPDTVRTQVIDYYASLELIKLAAAENDVVVDTAKVDEAVNSMKSNYETDEAWQEALTNAKTTEEEYRESITQFMTQDALKSKVGEAKEVTDEELIQYAQMYATSYDGARKSSHILFAAADEATAQEVLDKIKADDLDFAAAAAEYSTDPGSKESGGDIGWDKLINGTLAEPYQTALTELEKGQVSGLVTSDFGIHIIKCTDVFEAPEEVTSVDQLPTEFMETITTSLENTKAEEGYNEWFTTFKESAEIVTNPMPEKVPYNLDMSKYPAPEGTGTDAAGTGTDAASEPVTNEDGSTTTTNADGSTMTTHLDGSIVIANIDGTTTTIDTEGKSTTTDADGKVVEDKAADAA